VVWPSPGGPQVTLTGTIRTALGSLAVEGVRFRGCNKIDIDCAGPVAETFSDVNGFVSIQVDNGFDGYLEIVKDGYYPVLLFTNPPITQDVSINTALGLFTPAQFAGLTGAAGVTVNTERGHVLTGAEDCNANTTAGVSLTLSTAGDGSTPFYLRNSIPDATVSTTDDSGLGGFLNVTPGFAFLTGKVASIDMTMGKSSILVRKGYLSAVVPLIPSPL
jgi:hypothetical protein